MSSASKLDLSIVITSHREGIVAHKTILSIFRALEPFDKEHIPYEIIIHIDSGDEPTRAYYERYKKDRRFRIFENSYRDPAKSRNFAIGKARGKYTAILDGDDMVSRNWLIDSYNMIKKYKKDVILRPNFMVHFGGDDPHHNIWLLEDSFTKEEDALIMSHYNRWPNILFTATDLLKRIPFKPTSDGFGFEDWLFNCDTRAADIPNIVVPGTTLFYRRRANSVTTRHIGTILPYSELFDIDFIKSIKLPTTVAYRPESTFSKLKRGSKRVAVEAVKQIPLLNRALMPKAQQIVYKKQLARLPKALIETWKDINSIDGELYPTIETIVGVRFHPLSFNQHNTDYGIAYKRLVDQVTKKPDYLFLVPNLVATGGTEKLLANYASAIAKAHPDWQIAVLSAKPKNCAYDFPPNTDFIDFDGATGHLDWYVRDIVWSRLLVQLGVKRLHIIAHEGWLRWVARHKTLLEKNGYIVNVSMFMREFTHERGRVLSLADPCLREAYPVINKIFTDNQNIVDEMLAVNAFDPSKLVVHYQPEASKITKPKDIDVTPSKPLRILWASRLSYQKRVDLVKKIAQRLDPREFHIDVYGREQHYTGEYLKGIKSLTYKGSFNGFSSLPTDKYDVYLYTSDVDGLPNILLEVAAAGLPIVASNDGGVGEFVVNGKTGFLVGLEDIDGYIKALGEIRENPEQAKRFAEAAQELLRTRHAYDSFVKQVAKDIN